MKQESLAAQSAKIFQQWDLSETSLQRLFELEVDSVVLSRELTKLVDMSIRIVGSLRELRSSQLEQESPV